MATKDSATKTTRTRKSSTRKKVDIEPKEEKIEVKTDDITPEEAAIQMKQATEAMKQMAEATAKAIKKTESSIKKQSSTFSEDSLIECRSVTAGELILIGKKTGTKYVWSGIGDTHELELQDLNSLRASKSEYLFKPLFIIEDEDLLQQPKWAELKKLYDKITSDDVEEILSMSNDKYRATLANLPKGLQEAVQAAISTAILNDTFDSLQKVKITDELLGSDLTSLLK